MLQKERNKKFYQAIVDRVWDTAGKLDSHVQTLANVIYLNIPNDGNPSQKDIYKLKVAELCNIFANVCAKKEIFWDDSEYTSHELDYFKKTKFGEALWNFRCFVSQEPDKIKAPTQANTTATPKTSTPRTNTGGTGAGHTLYRNNAGGLIGSSKDILTGSFVYCIMGEFNPAGKTKPKIHVSPQGQSAPLRVKYTSGQGHNDCILYFDNLADADAFKVKCEATLPSNVAYLAVKKTATDPNGYVKVDTTYGQAWIKASKLHEEVIVEDVDLMEEIMAEINSKPAMSYKEAAEALNELLR